MCVGDDYPVVVRVEQPGLCETEREKKKAKTIKPTDPLRKGNVS